MVRDFNGVSIDTSKSDSVVFQRVTKQLLDNRTRNCLVKQDSDTLSDIICNSSTKVIVSIWVFFLSIWEEKAIEWYKDPLNGDAGQAIFRALSRDPACVFGRKELDQELNQAREKYNKVLLEFYEDLFAKEDPVQRLKQAKKEYERVLLKYANRTAAYLQILK